MIAGRSDYVGAKLLLVHDRHVLAYLRDDKPGLPWAGLWDLPGGGREGDETPEACVLRELAEEFGLTFPPARLLWSRAFRSLGDAARLGWFFAGRIDASDIAKVRFGNEGQH